MLRSLNYFGKCSRMIYFADPGYVKKDITIDGHLNEQDEEAVRTETQGEQNFHGFNITDDQALEAERLGIREDLANTLQRWGGGVPAAMRILDERINQRLQTVVAREISLERQRLGFIGSRFRAGTGFFGNVRNLFRRNTTVINQRLQETYGPNRDVRLVRTHLAEQVWTPLTPGQRMAMQTDLAGRGVPLPPPPPLPLGVNPQVFQLSLAEPEQLEEMRSALPFLPLPVIDPIFPTREQIPPPSAIERLIRFRGLEATERNKLLSTTVYDPTRMSHFMNTLRTTQPQISRRLDEILISAALYPIEKHPEAQAFIAYVEARIHARGPGDFLAELNNIRDHLPAITEKREEGKEASSELVLLEDVDKLSKSISSIYEKLRSSYKEAESAGDKLYEFRREKADHIPVPGVVDTKGVKIQESIDKSIDELAVKKIEINKTEQMYLNSTVKMLDLINGVFPVPSPPGGGAPDPYANLRAFIAQNIPTFNTSSGDELFGDTVYVPGTGRGTRVPSNFETHIKNFGPAQIDGISDDIKKQYHKRFWKRQRVTPRELLYLLHEGDFVRQGVVDEDVRRRRALYSTNKSIAFADNLQLFRTTNRELTERHGGSTLGSNQLNRLKKWLAAKMTNNEVFEVRDLVEYMAGFEKDKEFQIFKGLPKDVTLTELRKRIESEGGISNEKLFEFTEKLKQVFLSYEMLNREGKVSVHEGESMDMEMLIYKLTLLRQEMRSRKISDEVIVSTGDKAELMLKKIREDAEAVKKDEASIMAKIKDKYADWRQLFSKKVLEKKFIDSCREIRRLKKTEKLNDAELETRLAEKGLVTPYEMLKSGLMAEEAKEMAKTVAAWSGGKLRSGGNNLARGTSYIWEKGAKPVGRFGRDKIAKPVASAGVSLVTLPFRLAKKAGLGIWNWVGLPSAKSTSAEPVPAHH